MHSTTSSVGSSTLVRLGLAVIAAVLVVVAGAGAAGAADVAGYADAETVLVAKINAERAAVGLGALAVDPQLTQVARAWTAKMSAASVLSHNPDFGVQILGGWTRVGENVGYNWKTGASVAELVDRVHAGFMASPLHRDNVLAAWTRVGVGITVNPADNNKLWVTVNFSNDVTPMLIAPSVAPSQVDAGAVTLKSGRTARLLRTRR